MDESERNRLVLIIHFVANYDATAWALMDMAWMTDGVSDAEFGFMIGLFRVAGASQAVAESVLAMTWVADGVSDAEFSFTIGLVDIAESSAAVAESIISLPWVADGVSSDTEAGVAVGLGSIALVDADAAARVADMPFLQTLEDADAAALYSLAGLTSSQLADMLSRPMLKDGITDDEAPIVSMLYQTLKEAPNLVDRLLDPDTATVERRTVELPLAGEADLAIVRTRPGARRNIDLLENAVQEVENLMGEPLPTRYVGLLFENALDPWFGGTNFGTHIVIRQKYDTGEGAPHLIAHEVAHYYWRGSADWIDEGMAELTASAIENRRVGTPINVTNSPCGFVQSLKELEALAPKPGEDAFRCNYSLGEGLFVSLLRALGENAFWEGARYLYAATLDVGDDAGVEEVRQAFGADASDVIDRWYEGN